MKKSYLLSALYAATLSLCVTSNLNAATLNYSEPSDGYISGVTGDIPASVTLLGTLDVGVNTVSGKVRFGTDSLFDKDWFTVNLPIGLKIDSVTLSLSTANIANAGQAGEVIIGDIVAPFFAVSTPQSHTILGSPSSLDFVVEGFSFTPLFPGADWWASASYNWEISVSAIPIPPAVWLFGSGLIGLVGVARRKKS